MPGGARANPLPPHLAAETGLFQQEASPAHTERPLADNSTGQQSPGLNGRDHGTGSTGGTAPTNGEACSGGATELTEDNGKAEGVLQFGSSGARIPLYGRSVESILKARACSCD